MNIELDDLALPDSGTSGWVVKSLAGWYAMTADKMPADERKGAHGAFRASRSLRSAAPITIEVAYLGGSEADLLAGTRRLAALGYDTPVAMRVTDALSTTERIVSVRTVDVPDHHANAANTFAIDLLASDPRRYSIDDQWLSTEPPVEGTGLTWPAVWPLIWGSDGGSSGRITLTNRGTVQSSPVYRVYGGYDAATITNVDTGQRVAFAFTVPPGSYVEFRFSERRALLNGQSDVSRFITSREWWSVAGDGTATTQIDVTGAFGLPYLSGLVRSAW